MSESYVGLNGELEKGAVRTLEALRTLERNLQDINEASMRKVKFYIDQNKPCLQKKENSMPWYNNECKEAKKLRRQFIYALELFGTLVTPISEYGKERGGLKVSKSWEKQTCICTNLSQATNNQQ